MKNVNLHKFEEWLRNKNLKERTIENYAYCFNKFMLFGDFSQESIVRFLSKKENRDNNHRSFLVNLRKYLIINYEGLGISPDLKLKIAEVELPKHTGRVRKRMVKPLLKEEIDILEKYLDTEKLKIQLLLSYHSGLRLGELLKITPLSFNWSEWKKDESKLGECRVFGKGDKEDIAFVPSFLMKRIRMFVSSSRIKSLDEKIFIHNKNTKIKNSGRIWQMRLRDAGIKSGITKLDENKKPIIDTIVHPHRLRHSYGYYLKKKGMDIRDIQVALRHSSITSTEIYTYVDKEGLKKKLEEIN